MTQVPFHLRESEPREQAWLEYQWWLAFYSHPKEQVSNPDNDQIPVAIAPP